MVYIYYSFLSEKNHELLIKEYLNKFSIDYQGKINRFRRWQDAQFSLLGRILLVKAMENIKIPGYHEEISYTKYGKPYFKKNLIQFNVSHSGEIVVCALSHENEIGIDIEMITDIKIEDFKSQMTQEEWNKIIVSSNRKEAFFDYWTQKEAVIKAHGHGLTLPLKSFEVFENETTIHNEKYFTAEIKIFEKYKCYISSKIKIDQIILKKIENEGPIKFE